MIIDVQKAMDDGCYARRGQPGMEKAIAALLAKWRERGDPVIHIRHDSTNPNSPYRPGQPGNDFKPQVAPFVHETIVEKRTGSAFIGTDLMQVLENTGTTEIVATGVWLENCVESTVRMAGNLGFTVLIPEDCVASTDRVDRTGRIWPAEDVHALKLAVLDGEYASVLSSQDLLMEAQQ